MGRDLVALLAMFVGLVTLVFLAVTLFIAGEWLRFGLLAAGVVLSVVGVIGAQWDPAEVEAGRQRRLAQRAARRATRAEQERTGRVQMPRLPADPE